MTNAFQGPAALVADDHELFRAGAAAMLVQKCGFASVLQAGSLAEALTLLEQHPSISLGCFDLGMPGIGNPLSLKQIRERFPHVRLAVVTGSERRDDILLALQSGVHGYVPKTLGVAEIIRAFQLITAGGIYVPETLSEVSHGPQVPPYEPVPGGRPPDQRDEDPPVTLTARQQEVLRLIRSGRSNREIGWTLGLSENTVKVHTSALYKRLRVHSRFQAAASADRAGDGVSDTGNAAADHHAPGVHTRSDGNPEKL